jgi:hypothetical protein
MSSASNTAKPKWIPLESNPAAFNKYIRKIGVRGVYCVDVYGFDEELEFVPRPHLALLLCSPSYDKVLLITARLGALINCNVWSV